MEQGKWMTGQDAVELMRRAKLIPGATFAMRFITCDLNRGEYGQIRVYDECVLRPARRSEGLTVDSDHYLFFTDASTDEPRECFKKLIRAVCFPPSNQWLTVKWFL